MKCFDRLTSTEQLIDLPTYINVSECVSCESGSMDQLLVSGQHHADVNLWALLALLSCCSVSKLILQGQLYSVLSNVVTNITEQPSFTSD